MPSRETPDAAAIAVAAVFVVVVLLYGLFVTQQVVLAAIVALLGVAAYALWRYRRGP